MISRDELLERAVRNARPESNRWAHMTAKVRADPSVETFRWVILRLADPRVLARRFAVDVLFSLAFERRPWGPEAVAVLADAEKSLSTDSRVPAHGHQKSRWAVR